MTSHGSHDKIGWSLPAFLGRYVFSRDHKVIGTQFLFTTMIWAVAGGLLALAVRWQLAWPWSDMPIFGELYRTEGGQIAPEFYTMLFTMHASIMIFFVIIPVLAGAFGNWLIPLMIGADDMAFPTLNMLSYWILWPAFLCMGLSFLVGGYGPAAGWTAYPPLSVLEEAAPGSGMAQSLWLLGVTFSGIGSMMGSVNYLTTIVQMRAPGMTFFRLPMTIWGMFITAILQAFALPVLTAGVFMQFTDRVFGTSFFLPEGLFANNGVASAGGGQPLLWQHLFWFYSHPAVYIMLLPAMGMVSDMLSCFARKPLFGYKPMIYSVSAIAGLGFIVWGHHMFVSGMSPIAIGAVAGVVCAFAVGLKTRFGFDDALDVVGVHLMGGLVGSILIGFFADPDFFGADFDAGLFFGGGGRLLGEQVLANVTAMAWSFPVTLVLMLALKATIGVRVDEETEVGGLDLPEHAETAYRETYA